jgi:dTDP-4-amino-4,6-dideoxygalactose transaminase
LAEKAKQLRQYGWGQRYVSDHFGWNSRLDELQAAVLRVKLKYLDEDNVKRNRIADTYNRELDGTGCIIPPSRDRNRHVYHLYVARSAKRDELLSYLKVKGIMAAVHYPVPVHLQPAFRPPSDIRRYSLPVTEKTANEIISLPVYPELDQSELLAVISAVKSFFKK